MKTILFLIFGIFSHAQAYDCTNVPAFTPTGAQKVIATMVRFYWQQGELKDEEICQRTAVIETYDVRGRAEEAYYCLRPQVLTCQTVLNGAAAEISLLPAVWVRDWQPDPLREHRFHAYVQGSSAPETYYDVFSRALSADLNPQPLILEGSIRTGLGNPADGYWIRLEFQ